MTTCEQLFQEYRTPLSGVQHLNIRSYFILRLCRLDSSGFVVKFAKRDDDQPLSPQSLFVVDTSLADVKRKYSSFRAVTVSIKVATF